MSVLDFNKPKKARPQSEHNEKYVADSAPPCVYVPNMSNIDMLKWKGKHIKGENERVEIRKTVSAQMLCVVYKNGKISLSANGKMEFDIKTMDEFHEAIKEAKDILGI